MEKCVNIQLVSTTIYKSSSQIHPHKRILDTPSRVIKSHKATRVEYYNRVWSDEVDIILLSEPSRCLHIHIFAMRGYKVRSYIYTHTHFASKTVCVLRNEGWWKLGCCVSLPSHSERVFINKQQTRKWQQNVAKKSSSSGKQYIRVYIVIAWVAFGGGLH